MLPSKAINIYFGKLLFCINQHGLSFVIIKFELIRKHPRTDVRYTAFHGNDRISLISCRVRTKRQVKCHQHRHVLQVDGI